MPYPPERDPRDWPPSSSEERIVERRYGPAGNIEWERAGVRRDAPPALPAGPDGDEPLWIQALAWTVGGFWDGLRLVAEATLAFLSLIGGLALGVLVIALTLCAIAGTIAGGYWLGAWVGGPSGAVAGAWIAVGAVLLTIIGGLGRRGA